MRPISHFGQKRSFIAGMLALVTLLVMTAACSSTATNATVNTPWLVLMCKFKDQPQEPQPQTFFQKMFTTAGSGTKNLADYIHDQSYGKVSLAGSEVHGWYTMDTTLADGKKLGREGRATACINTAASDKAIGFSKFFGIAVMLNAVVDSGAIGGQPGITIGGVTKSYGLLVLDPLAWFDEFAAHEMLHGYLLNHSWDTIYPDGTTDFSFGSGTDQEYGDPFDIMSVQNVYGHTGTTYAPNADTNSGPDLIAPYRQQLGWLPAGKTYTYTGWKKQTLTLAPIDDPNSNGYLQIVIPVTWSHNACNSAAGVCVVLSYSGTYEVEYHRASGWSSKVGTNTVLINEIRANLAFLVRTPSKTWWHPGDVLNDKSLNLAIHVDAFGSNGNSATVTISRPSYQIYTKGVVSCLLCEVPITHEFYPKLPPLPVFGSQSSPTPTTAPTSAPTATPVVKPPTVPPTSTPPPPVCQSLGSGSTTLSFNPTNSNNFPYFNAINGQRSNSAANMHILWQPAAGVFAPVNNTRLVDLGQVSFGNVTCNQLKGASYAGNAVSAASGTIFGVKTSNGQLAVVQVSLKPQALGPTLTYQAYQP